jgi:preprotein translocase subunit YajC
MNTAFECHALAIDRVAAELLMMMMIVGGNRVVIMGGIDGQVVSCDQI